MRPRVALFAFVACIPCVACAEPGARDTTFIPRPEVVPYRAPASDASDPDDAPVAPTSGAAPAASAPPASFAIQFGHDGSARRFDLVETLGAELVATARNGADFKTTDVTVGDRERRTIEILSASPPTLRIAVVASEVTTIHEGRESRKTSPIEGKTYRVVLGSPVEITTDDGKKPRESELAILRKRFGESRLRAASALVSLGKREVRSGERSAPLESMLRAEFGEGMESMELGDVSAILVGRRSVAGAPCGVFQAHIPTTQKLPPDLRLALDFRGEVLVRIADSHIVRIDLAGPAKIAGQTRGVTVDGDGRAACHVEERAP